MKSFARDWENRTDEELIEMLREGESEIMDYLLEKYKNLVRKKANTLFLLGGDTDDLIQEGMIGLFKAVRDFNAKEGCSFATFAGICITRQMYKAVEVASRKKHGPLNSYISLSRGGEGEGEHIFWQQPGMEQNENPESLMIHQENTEQLLEQIYEVLSPLERQVLNLHLGGKNYHQIAELLERPEKSVDNALQRIKQKISKIM